MIDEEVLTQWITKQGEINDLSIELLGNLEKRLLAMEASLASLEKRARKVLGEFSES